MKFRDEKETDQDEAQKAFKLLIEFINSHDIEATLWVGAMLCVLAQTYKKSNVSFEYFKAEMANAVQHYKF